MSITQRLLTSAYVAHATPKKISNLILQKYEYGMKYSILKSYPSIAIIDPTNYCNLKCRLCPTGQGKHRIQGYISVDLFSNIIKQLSKYLFEVQLYNWGEPFLHKNIFDLISIVQQNNISSCISSNLTYLPEDYAKSIVLSGLEKLSVPLYGMTEESHTRYSTGSSLASVLSNIEKVVSARNSSKLKTPRIQIKYIVNKFNEGEINKVKITAKKLGVDLLLGKFMFNVDNNELRDKWEPRDVKYQRYNRKSANNILKNCHWPWENIIINYNGQVNPCCYWLDRDDFVFGNFNNNTLKEIWNNAYYVSARKMLTNKVGGIMTACNYCQGNPKDMDSVD